MFGRLPSLLMIAALFAAASQTPAPAQSKDKDKDKKDGPAFEVFKAKSGEYRHAQGIRPVTLQFARTGAHPVADSFPRR